MTRHRPADSRHSHSGGWDRNHDTGAISRSTTDYVEPAGGLPHRRQKCTKPWCATGLSDARTTLLVDCPQLRRSPIRSVSAPSSASPQRTTSLFTVCQSQPNSEATSSTERPRPPTWMVTHRAALDVNNARWGPIVGSCSMNDLSAQSVFGHVHRRFRHRSRTGRPNAGKSTNTTRPIALRPHRPATCHTQRAGLAGPDHHLQRCILARVVDPHQINLT